MTGAKMSDIRNRTVLCIANLPKQLTSRRNLRAHFSKFGEVEDLAVEKELRSAIIKFGNHFGAQAAKVQGKEYDGKSLNIFWSDSNSLDPRAKDINELKIDESEELWEDDNKECFGVESSSAKSNKPSAVSMIKQHLKLPLVKKRLGSRVVENKKEAIATSKPSLKSAKNTPKTLVSLKKSLLTQGNTRKLERKVKDGRSNGNKLKPDQNLKPAPSSSDVTDLKYKLKLLDERDKIIRQGTVQNSNIKTAVAIKGTCPDMCPERERVLRQVGHSIATYEMKEGTYEMDENKAVKEYIRSSADQEVPLPHDLRPGPVLSMTMNYLITNIIPKVDNSDENKAVWYSFCWNRLRSIRKDIILQQLCDTETVAIVEQCARFHISCYDHMWGAEISGFDDKINTQNLMDCLQTLKHMYEDLAKHRIHCPNESEFYSYLILLKLMSGDVMWEYQNYSIEMQLSIHVQFAIQAYMAFKNNMYSQYFSLVKRASYLTACLMQRYFDQVRIQALKIMSRAYSLPGRTVGLSSSFLVDSLKFDSHKNAMRFCERDEVDLRIDCDDNEDTDYVASSSFLIREKRLAIANAVVGESNPLPEHIIHQVSSSFDSKGMLKDSLCKVLDNKDRSEKEVDSLDSFEGEDSLKPVKQMNQNENTFHAPVAEVPSFQFSLIPNVKESIHKTNIFSPSETSIKSHVSDSHRLESDKESSMFTGSHHKALPDLQHTDMDEEMEQAFTFGEDYKTSSNDRTESYSHFSSSTTAVIKSDGPINQPFLSPFSLAKETPPTKSDNIFSSFISNSALEKQNKESFKPIGEFSFKNTGQDFFTSKQIVSNVESIPEPSLQSKNYNIFSSNYVSLKHLPTPTSLTSMHNKESKLCAVESEKKQEDKYVKEENEAERQRIEELKILEREKQKQIIEEQKRRKEKMLIEKLKKDLSVRMKAYYTRKYGSKYLSIWKEKVRLLKQSRDFPMLVSLSVDCCLEKWGSMKSVPKYSILERAREKNTCHKVAVGLLRSGITDSCKYIAAEVADNLIKSASKNISLSALKSIYWKMAVSIPLVEDGPDEFGVFTKLIKRWCTQSFYNDGKSLGSVETIKTSLQLPVNISVKLFDEIPSADDLQGIDAVVFMVLDQVEPTSECLERLYNLVSVQENRKPASFAIMNLSGNDITVELEEQLNEFQEEGAINRWFVNKWESHKSMIQSLQFLTDSFSVAPHICASSLQALIKEVCEDLFDALSSGQHSYYKLREALKNPNTIIQIYNSHLSKLENLLKNRQLGKYFNVAQEFEMHVPLNESGGPELLCGKEYDDGYRHLITKKINLIKLPELSKWPVKSTNRLLKTLKTYCVQVNDISVFPQIIRMIDLPDDVDINDHLEQCSWLKIVEIWAQCCLRHTFPEEKKRKQVFVIFNKNEVDKLISSQWWLKIPQIAHLECNEL